MYRSVIGLFLKQSVAKVCHPPVMWSEESQNICLSWQRWIPHLWTHKIHQCYPAAPPPGVVLSGQLRSVQVFPPGGEHGHRRLLLGRRLPALLVPGSLSVDERPAAVFQPLPPGQAQVPVNYVSQLTQRRGRSHEPTRDGKINTWFEDLQMWRSSTEWAKNVFTLPWFGCQNILPHCEGHPAHKNVYFKGLKTLKLDYLWYRWW